MGTSRKTISVVSAVLAVAAVITVGVGQSQGEAPSGDHWVDNLGTGTTASNFDGNSNSDCSSEMFQAGDYDLWHFVVNQASDPDTHITWNSTNSVWANPSSVSVVDVTSQYGPYTAGDGTKQLWIATRPAGATLVSAYLDYNGTAGRENLSHACGRSEPTPAIKIDPIISYDMSWNWTFDKSVVWAVNPAGGYTLGYMVEATKSATPQLVPGSLHVTDSVLVVPPSLELLTLAVSFTQGTYTQVCDTDLEKLKYDCTLDVTKVSLDSATGKPTGTGTLSAVATYSGGTLTDSLMVDFTGSEPANVFAESASISDDYATPSNTADDLSTTETALGYTVYWSPSGASCVERTNTAMLVIDNPVPASTNPSDSVTVRWCPPLPGLTIGYWGNKTGSVIVASHYLSLKATYPHVFALIGSLSTATAVRTFMQNATCNGNCSSLFAAQFLATAMNSLDPAFAAEGVMLNDQCKTVSQLLAEAEAGATSATKTWYEAYKSVFDAINNSRQTTCLTVID